MSDKNAIVAVYDTHQDAENAVYELQKVGFDLQKLSIVGRDHRTDQHIVGCYLLPGIGPVLVAGPLAAYIVRATEAAVVVDGLSAIGCGLFSIGIPKNSALKYESALEADKFLLIAQSTRGELLPAKHIILRAAAPAAIGVHATDPPKTTTADKVMP
jgi:hypothetical protein